MFFFMCLCFPWCDSINYNYMNHYLRESYLLPVFKDNYINYSSANELRNNFVDHGVVFIIYEMSHKLFNWGSVWVGIPCSAWFVPCDPIWLRTDIALRLVLRASQVLVKAGLAIYTVHARRHINAAIALVVLNASVQRSKSSKSIVGNSFLAPSWPHQNNSVKMGSAEACGRGRNIARVERRFLF